jgi:uncharacterized glyoxalase superfamily protein PhnB
MKPESLIPVLYSDDVRKSIAYYTEILGFEGSWEWDEDPSFGGVDWGDVRIFFCKRDQGSPGTWICINIEDLDTYYELIKSRGAKIISPPEDQPWFMREMLVGDPDGHFIRFGQGIERD